MSPSTIMFVVVKGSSIFFFRDEKGEWNFPRSQTRLGIGNIGVVRGLARMRLDAFFTEIVIHSINPFMPTIKDITVSDERVEVTVFKCEIVGDLRRETEGKVWFAEITNLPAHAISPDIRGIVDQLALNARFL